MENLPDNNQYEPPHYSAPPETLEIMPLPVHNDVKNHAFNDSVADFFSRNNPVALFFRQYRQHSIEWRNRNGRSPGFGNRVRLFLRTDNPFRIMHNNYRIHLSTEEQLWNQRHVNAIQNAVRSLGNLKLKDVRSHNLRVLKSVGRAIDEMIRNGNSVLYKEKGILGVYDYIFHCQRNKEYDNVQAGELCTQMRRAGVAETDLRYQDFGGILSGKSVATVKISLITPDQKPLLRSGNMVRLAADQTGRISLQNESQTNINPLKSDSNEKHRPQVQKPKIKSKKRGMGNPSR